MSLLVNYITRSRTLKVHKTLMSPLIGAQCRVISHETIYTQTTKTDSMGSSYIDFEYVYMYVAKTIKVVTITLRKSKGLRGRQLARAEGRKGSHIILFQLKINHNYSENKLTKKI